MTCGSTGSTFASKRSTPTRCETSSRRRGREPCRSTSHRNTATPRGTGTVRAPVSDRTGTPRCRPPGRDGGAPPPDGRLRRVSSDAREDLGLLRLELGVGEDAGRLQLTELLELLERVGCGLPPPWGGLLYCCAGPGPPGTSGSPAGGRRGSRPRSRFPRSRLRGRLLGAMASVTPFYAFADSSDSDASCRSGAGMPPLATSCAPLALTAAANGRAQRFS